MAVTSAGLCGMSQGNMLQEMGFCYMFRVTIRHRVCSCVTSVVSVCKCLSHVSIKPGPYYTGMYQLGGFPRWG